MMALVIGSIDINPPCCQHLIYRMLEKAIMMDKTNAMNRIMTLLNEDGLMLPGGKAHEIVKEYIGFKIDRMGPERALEDVREPCRIHPEP